MKKQDKLNWIIEYIKNNGWQNVFMEDFVESYVEECKPNRYEPTFWGAYKVPELSRYLSELYHKGILNRFTVGLKYHYDGFPKWCYGYTLNKREK